MSTCDYMTCMADFTATALYFLFIHHGGVNAVSRADFFRFGAGTRDWKFQADNDFTHERWFRYTPIYVLAQLNTRLYIDINGRIAFSHLDSSGMQPRHLFTNYRLGDIRYLDTNVAPFYANVDISGSGFGGAVYFRYSTNLSDPVVARINSTINSLCPIEKFHTRVFIVATWDRVGHYNRQRDRRNTFQCVVASDHSPYKTFAFFLYSSIEWTRATDQMYLPQVGFSYEKNNANTFRLPNTTTESGIRGLVHESNTGIAGFWAYKISDQVTPVGLQCLSGNVILQPTNILFTGAAPVNFNCNGPEGTDEYQWIINGTDWEGNTTHPEFDAEVLEDGKILHFNRIPASANNSEIYCSAVINPLRYDHRKRKTSEKAVLTLRGFPSAILNLEVQFHCLSHFELSWESPSDFDFNANDTFCAFITDAVDSSYFQHVQCGIRDTTYSITATPQEVRCKHTHNFTVIAVNWAGFHEAPAVTVFHAGSPLPTEAVSLHVQDTQSEPSSSQGTTEPPKEDSLSKQPTIIIVIVIFLIVLISATATTVGFAVYKKWHRAEDSIYLSTEDGSFISASSSTRSASSDSSDSSSNSNTLSWRSVRPIFM